jgi:hypothetical protein
LSVVVFVLVSVCDIVFRLLIVDFVDYSIKSFKKKTIRKMSIFRRMPELSKCKLSRMSPLYIQFYLGKRPHQI